MRTGLRLVLVFEKATVVTVCRHVSLVGTFLPKQANLTICFLESLDATPNPILIPATTPIWITGRTTIINIGTIRPRLCNQNPPGPRSTIVRFTSLSTRVTPGL